MKIHLDRASAFQFIGARLATERVEQRTIRAGPAIYRLD